MNSKVQTLNKKLCDVRKVFDQFNLISSLHTLFSENDISYKNIFTILGLLSSDDKKN